MTKLLTSSWMTLPVSVVVYLAATLFFWKTPVPSAGVGPGEHAATAKVTTAARVSSAATRMRGFMSPLTQRRAHWMHTVKGLAVAGSP